ncbi:hypothetical protein [Nioella sediminis]|jgi:hypothetical protein|uniref:hypothetical protein n=1 Tax=Nioella sediminis TaxID=1912092 RepID=UPI0008FD57B3|nr:hypothetical protein [Nioella sediminis]TBX20690.1 hypothetical protein TK43_14065 [Roseovarius sp. JS7-11]
MLGDYQSLAQLAVGLNVGFAAFYAYFGDTYFSERRICDGLQKGLETIKLPETGEKLSKHQEAKRYLGDADRELKRVGLSGVRSNYWPFAISLSAALLAFILLVDFSNSASESLTLLKSLLLGLSYVAVVVFAMLPLIRDLKSRRLIRQNLTSADDLIAELMLGNPK